MPLVHPAFKALSSTATARCQYQRQENIHAWKTAFLMESFPRILRMSLSHPHSVSPIRIPLDRFPCRITHCVTDPSAECQRRVPSNSPAGTRSGPRSGAGPSMRLLAFAAWAFMLHRFLASFPLLWILMRFGYCSVRRRTDALRQEPSTPRTVFWIVGLGWCSI